MKPIRLTIVALMVVIAAFGLLLAWSRYVLAVSEALAHQSAVGWVLFLVLGFGLSQALDWNVTAGQGRGILKGALALTIAVVGYLAWACDRCDGFASALQDSGFPYPDRAINAAERWIDARRPLPPGSDLIKMHSEYPMVSLVLSLAVLAGMAVIGIMLGALRSRDPRPDVDSRVGPRRVPARRA